MTDRVFLQLRWVVSTRPKVLGSISGIDNGCYLTIKDYLTVPMDGVNRKIS